MAWTWTNSNALKTVITVAWADEVKNGVKQLAADLYINPTNGGDGAADLAYPLEKLMPLVDGIATTVADTGVEIELGETMGGVDEYRVSLAWQEDPGDDSGDVWVEKQTDRFAIKISGGTGGKKIGYSAIKVVS